MIYSPHNHKRCRIIVTRYDESSDEWYARYTMLAGYGLSAAEYPLSAFMADGGKNELIAEVDRQMNMAFEGRSATRDITHLTHQRPTESIDDFCARLKRVYWATHLSDPTGYPLEA